MVATRRKMNGNSVDDIGDEKRLKTEKMEDKKKEYREEKVI